MSTDSLTITGLRVHAHHGVYDFERQNGQPFIIDLTLRFDLGRAGASDEVGDTVHYGDLATEVAEAVAADPVNLIETLAERVAALALAHDRVREVEVTIHKPDAPIPVPFDDVAVTIVRRNGAAQ